MILFPCPACRAALKARTHQAGRKLACPSCGGCVRIPDAEPIDAEKPSPSLGAILLHAFSDIGSAVVWVLGIAWCALWSYLLVIGLKDATTGLQEASVSAMCAAFVMIGYVIARGVETLLGRLAAWVKPY